MSDEQKLTPEQQALYDHAHKIGGMEAHLRERYPHTSRVSRERLTKVAGDVLKAAEERGDAYNLSDEGHRNQFVSEIAQTLDAETSVGGWLEARREEMRKKGMYF